MNDDADTVRNLSLTWRRVDTWSFLCYSLLNKSLLKVQFPSCFRALAPADNTLEILHFDRPE